MYKPALFMAIVFVLLTSPALALQKGDAKLDSVAFYPRGAMVEFRVASDKTAVIELPGTFDKESIIYRTTDNLGINDFNVEEKTVLDWEPPALMELKNRINGIRDNNSTLESEIKGLQQTVKYLQDLEFAEMGREDMELLIDRMEGKRIYTESRILQRQKLFEENEEELKIFEEKYNGQKPVNENRFFKITIESSGEGELYLQAWTKHAGWVPEYDLKLDSMEEKIIFSMHARAFQKTGIDFEGDLSFHTVEPGRSVFYPEVPPEIMDFAPKNDGAKALRTAVQFSKIDKAEASGMSENLTDLSVTSKGSIPGTGIEVIKNTGDFAEQGIISIIAAPLLSKEAFITVKVEDISSPLLAAKARLFIDGRSGGTTWLKGYVQGDIIELPFGRMPLVTTSRKEIIPKEGSNWIGKGRLKKGYTIELVNGMKTANKITLIDRYPLSAKESINIDDLKIDPEPIDISDENILTWKFEIGPGEKREIEVTYTVKYPSDEQLMFR